MNLVLNFLKHVELVFLNIKKHESLLRKGIKLTYFKKLGDSIHLYENVGTMSKFDKMYQN